MLDPLDRVAQNCATRRPIGSAQTMLARSSQNRSQRRASRFAAAALSVLCFSAQLTSLAHLALVRHVTCAEHGEAVDAPHSREPGAHGGNFATQPVHGAMASSSDQSESESHDHCPLAENRNAWALVVPDAIAVSCAAQATAIAPPHAYFGSISPSALCLLAPKTSPPV